MAFVFSFWYIVLAFLIVAVIASIVAFIKMDKKDRVLIDDFIKESTEEVQPEKIDDSQKDKSTN